MSSYIVYSTSLGRLSVGAVGEVGVAGEGCAALSGQGVEEEAVVLTHPQQRLVSRPQRLLVALILIY